jgi:hypothetical protein
MHSGRLGRLRDKTAACFSQGRLHNRRMILLCQMQRSQLRSRTSRPTTSSSCPPVSRRRTRTTTPARCSTTRARFRRPRVAARTSTSSTGRCRRRSPACPRLRAGRQDGGRTPRRHSDYGTVPRGRHDDSLRRVAEGRRRRIHATSRVCLGKNEGT